tara:strand:- start:5443 stop:6966 length:1524 start_codon:yes stop_codon:yes gene_type:complete
LTEFNYKAPGKVVKEFLKDDSFFRGLRGPVGSGKSVSCCIEVFRKALKQEPSPDGKRKSRWAVIRNTNPQLKTTTIKTWLDWFPETTFGNFAYSVPFTHKIHFHDVELEVIFLALDRPEDVKKLLSLELTGVWINEAREIPKSIVDACTMRVGRFPSMKDGGPTWYGVIADTNAPDEDHWWSIMSGEVPAPDHMSEEESLMLLKPDNWKFFVQPQGMLEIKVNDKIKAYELNKDAENIQNVTPEYYSNIIRGKSKSWIDVYVLNRLGTIEDGKVVYPSFREDVHIADEDIPFAPVTVYIGLDFGLTPSAVFGQKLPDGRWILLHELVCFDIGTVKFGELLKHEIIKHCSQNDLKIFGDPAGDFRAQTDETTPFQILRQQGIQAFPAPSNDVGLRIESVEVSLNRMVDGKPGFLMNKSCNQLRKGFLGGYHYRRIQTAGERYDDKPNKNKYSHVHDALQYLMLGAGEGRSLTVGPAKPQVANAYKQWNVFNRSAMSKRGKWDIFKRSG